MTDEKKLSGFAERLTHAMEKLGITRAQLAERVGYSISFVGEVVRGNKQPGAEFLFKLISEFGISADWLLTGKGAVTCGGAPIDCEKFQLILVQIGLARRAILAKDPDAKCVLDGLQMGLSPDKVLEPERAEALIRSLSEHYGDAISAAEIYNAHASITQEWFQATLANAILIITSSLRSGGLGLLRQAIGRGTRGQQGGLVSLQPTLDETEPALNLADHSIDESQLGCNRTKPSKRTSVSKRMKKIGKK
ncbi:MAG: helix-turn-helix transcriptional regulator [Sterolibacterium sp.]|nr:helix-turn-helix transcriptional regulator [Sterolibacterium sp.]